MSAGSPAEPRPVPGSVHSVSVSIPDVRSVIGFESGDPATLRRIAWGYPRFRTHPYVARVAALVAGAVGGRAQDLVLTRSVRAAEAAAAYAGLAPGAVFEASGVRGVRVAEDDPALAAVRGHVQHTGAHLTSREAEDVLLEAGLIEARQAEEAVSEEPAEAVRSALATAYGAGDPADVSLHNSGMNAVAAAVAAVTDLQRPAGRRRWIQLGWIFFDTMSLLDKRLFGTDHVTVPDPFDLAALSRVVAAHPGQLAGIIAELPSNPSLRCPDVPALREIADRAGCALVLDATIATPHNVDVLGYADVVCESLTKYATGSADVLMGAAVVGSASPWAAQLREGLRRFGDVPYHRDAARVAARIRDYGDRMKRVNAGAVALAGFLERQSAVRAVSWPYDAASQANYRKVERLSDAPGGLLMVDLRVPLERVYDRLAVAKGPSFGAEFTMASPQIFIAHFDLLSTPEGRAELRSRGLHRDMLRISVGVEDPELIAEVFRDAFDGAG
ncbi:L-2-amino-4-chloropent-4-enoate dechlorinase/desaturase BesB [Streptantibioticus cattleyicolor]|uniref:L-2-amino-4-chloropent-4-enoate dechlorinase/desaturase n=1 Tax=Streptantibioticus cattleyicolor (strain ATCC 35852 / DSM 46488 / JCM 4925 / NBRC 14057 / NRRL 8057) TaxID=1003195 RepID=BESB_STREN|nr:L-2-amino-4-chloropent-4-enoate dechlorinase/desaturase BesB [Streptantibioticus cattleyicolor]G8XHD7.2 RecName: Full=L-2-amino-4-chloropent-4-enoate dechlorinase/desaturase; AltName: Full=4-chloro-allyl-L-glycine acetylenase; AltName: Full=L-propargylglycine synthase [Streptantibioticus cattleyicolor NRRL 8057 = DSM 46488]